MKKSSNSIAQSVSHVISAAHMISCNSLCYAHPESQKTQVQENGQDVNVFHGVANRPMEND